MYHRTMNDPSTLAPPLLLRLGSEPIRWALLQELARSDRLVEELVRAVSKPQNLVSYHLARLRDGNLVTARRSARDGRAVYYRLNIPRCAELLDEAGRSLHPALGSLSIAPGASSEAKVWRVLFLCTANSARSQIAEGLLRAAAPPGTVVASAGSRPGILHPLAVSVMRARGIDISRQRSKHITELASAEFDMVVTVCDRVREECPDFHGAPESVHWSVPDPVGASGDNDGLAPFERAADELSTRVRYLLPLLG